MSEAFRAFEQKHGDGLPVMKGDFTGYWEDGAASSAGETALCREASERLVQAKTLWAMTRPFEYPEERFEEAWRNVLLYDEHTWGSWNSISAPEDDFTKQQWKIKKSFALAADSQSRELLHDALAGRRDRSITSSAVDVYNTHSWARTDLVVLAKELSGAGDRVKDEKGNPVPSQRLSTGELAILAKDVPPLGAKRFFIEKGAARKEGRVEAKERQLSNGLLTVAIDEASGTISSLHCSLTASSVRSWPSASAWSKASL